MITCPVCNGKGTTVNPNIDANGISSERFHDDPDFAEDYRNGVYDQVCAACDGLGRTEPNIYEKLNQAAEDRRLAALEDGDVEGYYSAHDHRYGF